MRIIEKFVGQRPESAVDFAVTAMEAFSHLPDYWTKHIKGLSLLVTNLSDGEFAKRFHISHRGPLLIYYSLKNEMTEHERQYIRCYILGQFISLFLDKYPLFKDIISHQGLGHQWRVYTVEDRTVIVFDSVNFFKTVYPIYLLGGGNTVVDYSAEQFVKRVEHHMKHGILSF